MKKQIRSSVFETNSSSTHSIAIPRSCNTSRYMHFSIGEFGWSFEEVDAADYFYTAIYSTSNTMAEVEEKIEKMKNILKANGIVASFDDANCKERNGWLKHDGYIDHGFELSDFVDELLNDEDKLLRFLSGGLVFTGNDNSDSEGFVNRDEEFVYHYDWKSGIQYTAKNPYYMSNHEDYEWEYKGN